MDAVSYTHLRDRRSEFVTDNLKALLGQGEIRRRIWTGQQKAFYYGNMTQEELDERREKLHGLYFEGEDVYKRQHMRRAGRKMPPGPHWAKIFFFICAMAFFSRRETWAWEMWISSATSIWVLPSS